MREFVNECLYECVKEREEGSGSEKEYEGKNDSKRKCEREKKCVSMSEW